MRTDSSDWPEPPWIYKFGSLPTHGCWRQGSGEDWLLDVWLPFWLNASDETRRQFIELFPPPDDLWSTYLTEIWINKS